MLPDTYINPEIKVVEDLLAEDNEGKTLKGSARTPFISSYQPEIDVSTELNVDMASRYSQLIGILRWAIKIGRLDIYTEVSITWSTCADWIFC